MSKEYTDTNKVFKNQCDSCVNLIKVSYLDLGDEQLYNMYCDKGIYPRNFTNCKCKEYINIISNK